MYAPIPTAQHDERFSPGEFAWRALEEIDYGLIFVGPDGTLQRANHIGRHELSRARFLRVQGGVVAARTPEQDAQLMRGVKWAAQGRRQMLLLREDREGREGREGGEGRPATLAVACVPLVHPFEGQAESVVLMLARQTGTQNMAVAFFARLHRLTGTEESVLKLLCDGFEVQEIAIEHGVTENTVRTQIRAVRDKTGAPSLRLLVQRVAALPPVVPMSLSVEPVRQYAVVGHA